jgi:hypothetical protein
MTNKRLFQFLIPALYILHAGLLYAQDPLPPKLKVGETGDAVGEIEISSGRSLRLKPVPVLGSPPTSPAPEKGDLYFDGNLLHTYTGNVSGWQTVSEQGDIFYNDSDNALYFHDGTVWKKIAGEGPKTVATRIVAALDTPDGATRAHYVCDGSDDQVMINRAINSLPKDPVSGKTYGAVYLLEGTYNISTALTDEGAPTGETLNGIVLDANHDNTAIIGTGRGTVLKVVDGALPYVINAKSVNGILISQLMIDGNNGTGSARGIYFDTVTNSKIDKVWVEKTANAGIYLRNFSNNNTITNNNVLGSSLYLVTDSSNNIISHNNVQDNNAGVGINIGTRCRNNIASNNNVQGNYSSGIALSGANCENNIASNNNVHENAGGFFLAHHNIISNNTISNNNLGPSSSFTKGIAYQSGEGSIISSNTIQGHVYGGIYQFMGGIFSNGIITGNVIYDNGGSEAYDGIYLRGSTNIISSNRLYDSAGTGYGINIADNGCDNNYLVGNLIDGPGYTNRLIQDLGSNTKYTDKAKITLERQAVLNVTNNSTVNPFDPTASGTSWRPVSYVPVVGNGGPVIADATTPIASGKSAGDILILEGTDNNNTVTVPDSGNVSLNQARTLGQYDTLELIWNGTKWLETEFVNN